MDIDMAHDTPTAPLCAPYAPLLPLVHVNELRLDDRPDLREHLASCVRCQARLAAYDVVDGALRRQFAAERTDGMSLVSFADIAQRVAKGDHGEITSERAGDASTPTGGAPAAHVARRAAPLARGGWAYRGGAGD